MSHDHAHGHEHPSFLAHHFDDPEQQFDSGKLGIWIFLVTEVLFFSGMFCAYSLYRARNPEVWTFASQFLNTSLGAFNTGVLLFSSLTMAWGVRCAQLRQRGGLMICLTLTLMCAAIFLGVKAVEYTHKWDMGLLPAHYYQNQYSAPHLEHHSWQPFQAILGRVPMDWLTKLCIVPGLILVGIATWTVKTWMGHDRQWKEVTLGLLLTSLGFFCGVGIGLVFQNAEAKAHETHQVSHDHAATSTSGQAEAKPNEHQTPSSDGPASTDQAAAPGHLVASSETGEGKANLDGLSIKEVDQPGGAGLFFSIYYCMTGVHAFHILGGMVVLTWLLIRASKNVFHEQYFGPVDYVGLYWHLVDLIWIYLFPLLYLIR